MAGTTITRRLGGAALCAVVAACAVRLDDEAIGDAPLGEAHERCVVAGDGSAVSLRFPRGALWIVGDRGFTVGPGDDPCVVLQGPPAVPVMLPLTAEEASPRGDGARWVVRALSGWTDGEVGWLFYQKVLSRGVFDEVPRGVGIARVTYGRAAERATPGAVAGEPTLLWAAPLTFGASAYVAPDGFVYAHGCLQRSAWDFVCRVARADAAHPDDARAWSVWDDQAWSADVGRATSVLAGVPDVATAWVAQSGRVLAVHAGFLEDRVYARYAASAVGPFGRARPLFDGTKPAALWIHDVRLHAAGDDDRLFVTYGTSPEGGIAGLRIVEVKLR